MEDDLYFLDFLLQFSLVEEKTVKKKGDDKETETDCKYPPRQ